MSYYYTGIGTIQEVRPVAMPEKKPEPTTGTRMREGEIFVYVINDNLNPVFDFKARTLSEKIWIAITNSIYVPRRWYFRDDVNEWRVDQFSKISFWPEELQDVGWYPYFFSGMTPRQHELFNVSGFGWRDAKANAIIMFFVRLFARITNRTIMGIRPDGVNIYNFLLCSSALLRVSHLWRQWTIFHTQDTNKPPNWETYEDAPDRVFKQSVCGHNSLKQSFYGSINQHQGDLFIPTACPGGLAAILTSETRRVRDVPFDTVIDDVLPVRFVELCFVVSEVVGLTDKGDWYLILEQRTKNGNQADFVLHIPKEHWLPDRVLPVSTVGWQLE